MSAPAAKELRHLRRVLARRSRLLSQLAFALDDLFNAAGDINLVYAMRRLRRLRKRVARV